MADNRAPQAKKAGQNWTGWHSLALLVIVVAIGLVGLFLTSWDRLWAWLLTLILLAFFAMVAGHGIMGLWRGLLIDEQNRMSLSRLQMMLWTIVVLSGFLTAGLSNLAGGAREPLSIAIPSELWLLMGISTTSLIGSPLIKSAKKGKPANPEETDRSFSLMAVQRRIEPDKIKDAMGSEGQLVYNVRPEESAVSDLFKGEETGNAAHLDLGKVQMFYFTLILVLAYAVALGTLFANAAGKIAEFPALDTGMVALLGISHAGYLTYKGISHSKAE